MNIPIDKLAVFDIIKDLDCIVVVLAVSEEIFAQVTAMGRMSLMISALVLGAAILILWIVTASVVRPISQVEKGLRACLIIRESKRNSMKMRTNFHKFSVNSRTIDIKFGGIGAIFMRLQPIHQLSNTLLKMRPGEKGT